MESTIVSGTLQRLRESFGSRRLQLCLPTLSTDESRAGVTDLRVHHIAQAHGEPPEL